MKPLKAMKSVYSYYFPEIRAIIDDLHRNYPHELFLTSSDINLDMFHEIVIEKLLAFYSNTVPQLNKFPYGYPTSGSNEGIREYLTYLQGMGVTQIYVLKGEYEGYKETAKTRNIKTLEIDFEETSPESLDLGIWFISNPSARDGNIIPNKVIRSICDAGHKLFYDLAYVGSTKPHRFDLSHENIEVSVISLSKSFGLFRYRIGVTLSMHTIPSLYANKWFKSIPALLLAEKIFDQMTINELYDIYRPIQKEIINEINEERGLGIKLSDAILMGYLPMEDAMNLDAELQELIALFKRENLYRFCLTPYFVEKESR